MYRLIAAPLLALSVLTAPAHALDLSAMTDADRDAFRAEVRAYLMDNPEVIVEAVNLLEQRQAAAEAQADLSLVSDNADAIFNDGFSWVGGNPEGDITLVEFLDYRCGFCRRAMPEVEKLLANDGNIRLIIKELPILGEDSLNSSRFAIATKQVEGNAAYKRVHDALMELSGPASDIALERLATSLELDAEAIMAQVDSDAVTQEIAATRALAQKLKINGTPTFVLQDELLRGFLPADQMAEMIETMRDR